MALAVTRQRKPFDLQAWLEERAQGPVYASAVLSMVMRAALFYSGQGATFERMVGVAGMSAINTVTAVGLAGGGELMGSIAGRSWKRNRVEAREAKLRRDLKPQERDAMAEHFASAARIDFFFMLIGVVASYIAAFSYMWIANQDHSFGAVLGELVLTTLLIAIVTYLGVFKENKRTNASEARAARADALSDQIVDNAGQRIATNHATPQDVRLFARALPTKADRDRFLAAFASETPDDPHWTTTDIAIWLNCTENTAAKRQITRKLARLADAGAPVMRDDRNAYRVPRSAVFLHFADDFLAMSQASASGGRRTPTARSIGRQSGPMNAQYQASDSDAALSTSGAGQAGASGNEMAATA